MNNIIANYHVAVPEMFLLGMSCVILLLDLYSHKRLPVLTYALTQLTLLVTFLLILTGYGS